MVTPDGDPKLCPIHHVDTGGYGTYCHINPWCMTAGNQCRYAKNVEVPTQDGKIIETICDRNRDKEKRA